MISVDTSEKEVLDRTNRFLANAREALENRAAEYRNAFHLLSPYHLVHMEAIMKAKGLIPKALTIMFLFLMAAP